MGLFDRNSTDEVWTWDEVAARALALYQARGADERFRTAVLIWQGDDPRVELDGGRPPLLVCTLDVEAEPGTGNAVALAGFESLEAARAACVEWVGQPREADLAELPETAQIGIYATLRNPAFAAGS